MPESDVPESDYEYPSPIKGPLHIKDFFDRKIEHILNLYATTSDVSHQGEKGAFREIVLRSALSSILPPHFGLGTGLIIDGWGRQSRQTDIIVYDRRVLPPVIFEENHGIYPFDSVHRAIEVKSILKKEDLKKAEEAARLLQPDNPSGLKLIDPGKLEDGKAIYPFCAIFAYDANWDINGESFPVEMKDNLKTGCRIVCVAKKNFISICGNSFPTSSPTVAVRYFAILMLESIEASAKTRSDFTIGQWLAK